MKFDVIVDWGVGDGVGRVVGYGINRGIAYEVDSDVGDEGGERFEL